jgi:hypothetical protein
MNSINGLKLDRDALSDTWNDQKLNIDNLGQFETVRADLISDINEKLEVINQPIASADFDVWLFSMLDGLNYRIWDASFSNRVAAVPSVNVPDQAASLVLDELIKALQTLDPSKSVPTTTTQLWYNTATYTLNANYTTFEEIVARLQNIEGTIYLSTAEFDFQENFGILTFEIYSLDRLSVDMGD